MKARRALSAFALCLAFGAAQVPAQGGEQKCPIVLNNIELSYSHRNGVSKPQFRADFSNAAGKQITTVTFTLSLLDSGGYPHPYPDDLVYRQGLESGMRRIFAWNLAPESVDIHRTGETLQLERVEFADSTSWMDDGSESCVLTVDFHPR